MFDKLAVECRAGYKAEEEPVRFSLDGEMKAVKEVRDRWYGPDADYFKVQAEDGCLYLLRHDRRTFEWSLRYVRICEPRTPLVSAPSKSVNKPH